MEVSTLSFLGVCASLVPFSNHNQSARVNAGAKNQKQALGLYVANYLIRMDMDVNLLQSPQVPLVRSAMHTISEYGKHPS